MKDFVKNHPYIMCNIAGAVFASSAVWLDLSGFVGFWVAVLVYVLTIKLLFPLWVILLNIAGFTMVAWNSKTAVAFAVGTGSIGAFIAVHTVNKEYEYRKFINIAFIVTIWAAIWSVLSYQFFNISV
ncbi:MAG: hypothetical protein IJ007_09365 [Oscillospiraceae bacterium]|nr:hypothetical protein [Oscillospiraceae bacterium]